MARAFAWVALAVGTVSLLGRLTSWIENPERLAADGISVVDIIIGLVGGGGFSLSLIVFGYLMIRGAMPTWLGIVWIICGVTFWVGILPLWFFVGAVVFGIRGLVRFRAGNTAVDRISAVRVSLSEPTVIG